MIEERVGDDEKLFRRIPCEMGYYTLKDGAVHLSSSAFSDRLKQTSVDRSCLCHGDPSHTQEDPRDGVAILVASEVREISAKGKAFAGGEVKYVIDVVPDPDYRNGNLAHAIIVPTPSYETPSVYKRVTQALARLAERRQWAIQPADLR